MTKLKLGQYFVPAPPPKVVKKYFGLFGTETIYFDEKLEEDAYIDLSSCTLFSGANYQLRQHLFNKIVATYLKMQKNVIWVNSYNKTPSESSINLRQLLENTYPELHYQIGFLGMSGLVSNHLQEVLYSQSPTWSSLDQFKFNGGKVLNCYVPWEDVMASSPSALSALSELLAKLAEHTQAVLIFDWDCESSLREPIPNTMTGLRQLGGTSSYSDELDAEGASSSNISRYENVYLSRQNLTPTLVNHLGWEGLASEDAGILPDNILMHYNTTHRRVRFIVLEEGWLPGPVNQEG